MKRSLTARRWLAPAGAACLAAVLCVATVNDLITSLLLAQLRVPALTNAETCRTLAHGPHAIR